MRISYTCPSCGATGSVDDSLAGRSGRCRHCRFQFTIPQESGSVEAESYALETPVEPVAKAPLMAGGLSTEPGSTFRKARGKEQKADDRFRPRSRRGQSSGSSSRKKEGRFTEDSVWAVLRWFPRLGLAIIPILLAAALIMPGGLTFVGWLLVLVGTLMVLVGYAAGAYGAFSEDFLYGFLFVAIPFYAAYYILTRWDDLWPWFLCSTLGTGLVLFGTQCLQWSGALVVP